MARSIITIDDLSNEDIEHVFAIADELLNEMGDPTKPYRIRGRKDSCAAVCIVNAFFRAKHPDTL